MQQTALNDMNQQRPFATTGEKYNTEYANRKGMGSNFPYHEVKSLPGYAERGTPSLSGSDVTKELARYLAEYTERNDCSLPYPQREIAMYLWWQASRGMLAWEDILKVVRSTKKRDRDKPIAHYFGYQTLIGKSGSAKDKTLIKLIRYVTHEGECAGCLKEFRFDEFTLDRIVPGKANGTYDLANVQLMCKPCNTRKGSTYTGQATHRK